MGRMNLWAPALELSVLFGRVSGITYQQNEKDKEHIGEKVDGAENPVGAFDGVVVKVTKNNSELCEPKERQIRD